jgi:hypothetical protein
MTSETLVDCRSIIVTMRANDAKVPIHAKIELPRNELSALKTERWSDMLPQTRKAIESAIASLDAALVGERNAAKRHFYDDAGKGQLAVRHVLRAIE